VWSEGSAELFAVISTDSYPISFVHQQKDGLEFGRKRYRFALACVEMCQIGIDGLLQAHYFPAIWEAAKSTRERWWECLHAPARPALREGSKQFDIALEECWLLG